MKKIVLLTLMLFFVATAMLGQSKKGDFRLTIAGIPLIGEREGTTGMSGFVLKPSVTYFITDNFSTDLSFNYSSLDDLTIDGIPSNYVSYSFLPSFRYSVLNKSKISVFLETGFGLGTIKYSADNASQSNFKHNQNSGGIGIFNIGVGADYFFNKKFGVQIIVPYISVKNITSDFINTIYSGLSPTLGITFKI